ncbi:MAG TPA: DinB family protein, partial [Acidimicrobiales bacterium]|nr:DinB family protein [Acidimicrobiales bacterium]
MTIIPDTKDWTWVLSRPCPDCGFDASKFPSRGVSEELQQRSAAWRPLLARPDAVERPKPTTWSTLEYGCHVRDVFRIFDVRLVRMLQEDDPLFENWDQDATALAGRYGEQQPGRVADELEEAGANLADRLDQVGGDDWSRPGRRSDGATFT